MSVIRVHLVPEFHFGDDAVVLALDGDGVADVLAAINEAIRVGSSRLQSAGVTHEFRIESGFAAVELNPTHVLWRLDGAKADEIAGDLEALSGTDGPTAGHFYVDIATPAETLVISRDEYVDAVLL